MKIIGIDPSYRTIGMFLLRTHPQNKDLIFDMSAHCIVNRCSQDDEDFFLYNLAKITNRLTKLHEKTHIVIEYTFVPRIKPMSLINRVIGTILASSHLYLNGWQEVNMNSVYAKWGIPMRMQSKDKKLLLRDKMAEVFNKVYEDNKICLHIHDIRNSDVKERIKKVSFIELPQDCIDAYALVDFVLNRR